MSPQKPRRVLRLRQVMERTGFGRDTVYRLARLGKFPKPFKLSEDGNASGWLEAEIDQFIEQRAATRGNAAA